MREPRLQFRRLALLAAVVLGLYLCWLMIEPFADVLIWATVLAILAWPVHRRLLARLGRPALAAVLACLFVVVVVVVPVTIVSFAVVAELGTAAHGLREQVAALLDPNSPRTGDLMRWVGRFVDLDQLRSQEFFVERIKQVGGTAAIRALGLVGDFMGLVVHLFFVLFTLFYFLRDGETIGRWVYHHLPLERNQSEEIFQRTKEVIGASVYGVIIIAAVQGLLGGLAFWALGLPSPPVWGVTMMLLSMIPVAGAFVVWVPVAIYLLAVGHWVKALLLTVWGLGVIGTVDNLLRPMVVGHRTKMHELLIFFSVLGGLQVFGVMGIVLGPVVFALTLALLDIIRRVENAALATKTDEVLPVPPAEVSGLPPAGVAETSVAG